jgi:hypothetical protein
MHLTVRGPRINDLPVRHRQTDSMAAIYEGGKRPELESNRSLATKFVLFECAGFYFSNLHVRSYCFVQIIWAISFTSHLR